MLVLFGIKHRITKKKRQNCKLVPGKSLMKLSRSVRHILVYSNSGRAVSFISHNTNASNVACSNPGNRLRSRESLKKTSAFF